MSVTERETVPAATPGNPFAGDVPMVSVMRGDLVGSLHRGSVAVVDTSGRLVAGAGDPRERAFLRSAAKPFQVMPAIMAGGLERFDITAEELAVLCASHSGEPRHLDAVHRVLEKMGLDEGYLQCGVHPPLNQHAATARWRDGLAPSSVCNNCSGAHAGMLLACVASGWPLPTYGEPDHPLQVHTREILATFAGVATSDIGLAVDNCAVPTFQLPLDRAALAFARLATGGGMPSELAAAGGRVVQAMTRYPEMVGGEDRFDTDLMRATRGFLVAKGGAEGFQGLGIPSPGLGLALKISDGAAAAVGPAVLHVLDELHVLPDGGSREMQGYRRHPVRNMRGEIVGSLQATFELRRYA